MIDAAVRPFETDLHQLLTHLAVLDLRLVREVQRVRARTTGPLHSEFRGLLVSDEQIDGILSNLPFHRAEEIGDDQVLLPLIRQRERELEARRSETLEHGVSTSLERLSSICGLTGWDMDVIVLCLAPELDLRYEALFAYLQDDTGKRRPTVDLALRLLGTDLSDRLAKRGSFRHPSPLVKHKLIEVTDEVYGGRSSLLPRTLHLDQRVVDYIFASDGVDQRLRGIVRCQSPRTSWDDVVLPDETKARLLRVSEHLVAGAPEPPGVVLQLVGPTGAGKKSVAQAMCRSLGKNLLIIQCSALLQSDLSPRDLVTLIFREADLQSAIPYWSDIDLVKPEEASHRALVDSLKWALRERAAPTILAGRVPWESLQSLELETSLTLDLPLPDLPERQRLWENHLVDWPNQLAGEDVTLLASKFRLSGAQIRQAVATARSFTLLRPMGIHPITSLDLHAASRLHSNQRLGLLAQKIECRYVWDDIVLPDDQEVQLREVCGYFRNMPMVYGQWGFESKASLGKGLNILFAGPSGTGKTMAAEIMAGELGLDLYKIDLSSVVSKYIGETEKNLDRIFREAEDSNAILFFDEADALFGKRSEVKDSHDRYANIEISYLLQKMEEYQGIVILATNLRKNMDNAFVRRLHFAVDFPFPDEEHRLKIWRRVFPDQAPLDASVDLPFVSRQLKLAGGNIRNIAVTSAFLAAQQSGPIGMQHIMWAAKREYQKMGRLLVEGDFGRYFALVKQ